MAGEISAKVLVTGKTYYYAIIKMGSLYLNGSTPETRDDSHWGAYKVPLTEGSLLGEYLANAPTGLSPGSYSFDCYQQAGGSAAPNDLVVATGGGFEVAAAVVPASSYTATLGAGSITLGQAVRVWYQLDHPLTGTVPLVITPSDTLASTFSPTTATIQVGQSVASLVINPSIVGAHNLTSTVSGGPGGITNQSTPVTLTVAASSGGGSAPTVNQIVQGVENFEVEDGVSFLETQQRILASLIGVRQVLSTVAGVTTVVLKNPQGDEIRSTVKVNAGTGFIVGTDLSS